MFIQYAIGALLTVIVGTLAMNYIFDKNDYFIADKVHKIAAKGECERVF